MEDHDFREIVLYEIRELRKDVKKISPGEFAEIKKDVKKLNNFRAKFSGIMVILLFIAEFLKHKFLK